MRTWIVINTITICFFTLSCGTIDCSEEGEQNITCAYQDYRELYNLDTLFPWNSFNSVKLFVYQESVGNEVPVDLISGDKVLIENSLETIELNDEQIDSLKSTFLSWKVTEVCGNERSALDCDYFPHEAIVFYRNQQPIAFFEIAFDCDRWNGTVDAFWGYACDNTNRLQRIKTFFTFCGVKNWID
ncbi:hypothetical protein K6119_09800 [Paracrocinitomix mangrovi]|uniref:hypothetical protein n=1 Tax=Paracrocinitomix mangrovi TaxID=2862509 RepID=UPI001C8E8C7A|nr:hypothetical protein [Paracrocinitomix mangrovi]UKN03783.1 hypothetical protein K6119_09800 [Paracrocinitomix mangrovi]